MMMHLLLYHFLAQVPAAAPGAVDNSGEIITGFVVAVVGAAVAAWARSSGRQAGRAESVEIKGQPLHVKLQEEFVTRREFERLEASMGLAATRMEGLFRETMGALSAQNTTLTKKIENLGTRLSDKVEGFRDGARLGRIEIWNKVNEQATQISKLEGEVNVSRSLNQFGDAIREAIEAGKEAKNG